MVSKPTAEAQGDVDSDDQHGTGAPETLHHSVWCAIGRDGTIVGRSDVARPLLGAASALFDAVVPTDRERVLQLLATPPTIGACLDLRMRDGAGRLRTLEFEVRHATDARIELAAIDVTEARRLQAIVTAQREVLDQIATEAPVATALDAVARMVEAVAPDASVVVLARRGANLELAAAPSATAAFAQAAASIPLGEAEPEPGTLEPLSGVLAEVVERHALGFGWWTTVTDESSTDVARLVVIAGEKRFLSAEERLQCDEAVRLIAVAIAAARTARVAVDADARDPLTGLLHRGGLLRALGDEPREGAVALLVEIEGLAAVNTRLGYGAGDVVVRSIAERLRRALRARDLLARWSGARFVVVGRARHGDRSPDLVAQRVRDAIGGRVMVSGEAYEPDCRVVVVTARPGERTEGLLCRLEAGGEFEASVAEGIGADAAGAGASGDGASGDGGLRKRRSAGRPTRR